MNWYRIDLHIHTALSPCTSDEMSPVNIVKMAKLEGLSLIAITDHNASFNCVSAVKAGEQVGVTVLFGMEVQTKEEVHVLTLFEDAKHIHSWQEIVSSRLKRIPNNFRAFGQQLVFDPLGNIVLDYPWVLQQGLDYSLEELTRDCTALGGLVIPAHIDRPSFGLIGQLGFIPPNLACAGWEISSSGLDIATVPGTLICNSDAHDLTDLIRPHKYQTWLYGQTPSFSELVLGLANRCNRRVVIGKD